MRFLFALLLTGVVLRFLPGLLLRLVLVLPHHRELRSVCLVGGDCSGTPQTVHRKQHPRKLVRLKPLLLSSSVLAILALAAAALVEWHPAALMLLLR